MLSSYNKLQQKYLNNSSDDYRPEQNHPTWETHLYKHFPKLKEGYIDVDDFVSEMRTVEKAHQLGCIFIILNGKNNGMYPSSVKFRCAGIRGSPCQGSFILQRDNMNGRYYCTETSISHQGHKQLNRGQIEKALTRIQSRRNKLSNTLTQKRKNNEFMKLKNEIFDKELDGKSSSPSYQNYEDDEQIRRKIKMDPNKSPEYQEDALPEMEDVMENDEEIVKTQLMDKTNPSSKKVYKSLLKYMKKENDLLLQCYETTQELYHLEQLENQKLISKVARLKQENYMLKHNGELPEEDQDNNQQQVDQLQTNNQEQPNNDSTNEQNQQNSLQSENNGEQIQGEQQQSANAEEINSY